MSSAKRLPRYNSKPIISTGKRLPAFAIDPKHIIWSLMRQFSHYCHAFRECCSNSIDAHATKIMVKFSYDRKSGLGRVVWADNGDGMTLKTIKSSYLTLFASPLKEDDFEHNIGYFSLGRLSLFALEPELVKITTRFGKGPAHQLVIKADMSGTLSRLTGKDSRRISDLPGHGMVVEAVLRKDESSFLELVSTAVEYIGKILRWIKPRLTVEWPELDAQGLLATRRQVVNVPFGFSAGEEFTARYFPVFKQGKAEVVMSLSRKCPFPYNWSNLTKGYIPVMMDENIPWFGPRAFYILGLHIAIESFYWSVNIGRSKVDLNEPFAKKVLEFTMRKALEEFVPGICSKYGELSRLPQDMQKSFQNLLADLFIESERHKLPVAGAIQDFKFIPSYDSLFHSISELCEGVQVIRYSDKPAETFRSLFPFVILNLSDFHYAVKRTLSVRLGERFVYIGEPVFVDTDNTPPDAWHLELLLMTAIDPHWMSFSMRLDFSALTTPICRPSWPKDPGFDRIIIRSFLNWDNTRNSTMRTTLLRERKLLALNVNHEAVRRLIDLPGNLTNVKASWLIREALREPALDLSESEREDILLLLTENLITDKFCSLLMKSGPKTGGRR